MTSAVSAKPKTGGKVKAAGEVKAPGQTNTPGQMWRHEVEEEQEGAFSPEERKALEKVQKSMRTTIEMLEKWTEDERKRQQIYDDFIKRRQERVRRAYIRAFWIGVGIVMIGAMIAFAVGSM